MAKKMKGFDMLALILLIVGGINWGLVGAFDFNLVEVLLGTMQWLMNTVYVLVGASGIYTLYYMFR